MKTEKHWAKSVRKAVPNDDTFSKTKKTGKDTGRRKIAAHRGANVQKRTQIHTQKSRYKRDEEFVE